MTCPWPGCIEFVSDQLCAGHMLHAKRADRIVVAARALLARLDAIDAALVRPAALAPWSLAADRLRALVGGEPS
ncbi:MAG: hypothetical protein AAB875_04045 [Patescibacteria group bacterium]